MPVRYAVLSIHDLSRRSTLSLRQFKIYGIPFNSRPLKEVDVLHFYARQVCGPFNSRPLKEVDYIMFKFASTFIYLSIHDLSRRSTRRKRRDRNVVRPFNSRPLKEVDLSKGSSSRDSEPFNSRPLKEVDHAPYLLCWAGLSFNSRPLKEVDGRTFHSNRFCICLSIHDLSRRSTQLKWMMEQLLSLSIHDLSRRSTWRKGRQHRWVNLSIHDLSRRSTCCNVNQFTTGTFQFTTSQGGRPNRFSWIHTPFKLSIHDLSRRSTLAVALYFLCNDSFNSRPLKEVDGIWTHVQWERISFNSRPLKEVDRFRGCIYVVTHTIFQFTTSQGGRPR